LPAAADYQCCPCFGHYRSSGVFCDLGDGCNRQNPKEKKSKKERSYKEDTKADPQLDKNKIDEVEQNETAEEQMAMRRGKFIYCDPFSQDLDCGDESWYITKITKYSRTSVMSKTRTTLIISSSKLTTNQFVSTFRIYRWVRVDHIFEPRFLTEKEIKEREKLQRGY
jgi:hypothetical protein